MARKKFIELFFYDVWKCKSFTRVLKLFKYEIYISFILIKKQFFAFKGNWDSVFLNELWWECALHSSASYLSRMRVINSFHFRYLFFYVSCLQAVVKQSLTLAFQQMMLSLMSLILQHVVQ